METAQTRLQLDGLSSEIMRGATAVCNSQTKLTILAHRLGYPEAMSDLVYFVSKPGVVEGISNKISSQMHWPKLLRDGGARLIRRLVIREAVLVLMNATVGGGSLSAEELVGALLIYEYRILGLRTRFLTTNDRSGKQCFVGPSECRPELVAASIQALCAEGANVLLVSLNLEAGESGESLLRQFVGVGNAKMLPAVRERRRNSYLPLLGTLESTLEQIGRKMRKNLVHARRVATNELGCTFHERIQIEKTDLLTFNRRCMYAVPEDVACWRLDCLPELSDAFLCAMRDSEGQLLSLIACRRWDKTAEILWQMNLDGYRQLSLSLASRSFLIESEINYGTVRLQVEGGAINAFYRSFEEEDVLDLALVRQSKAARVLCRLVRGVVQEGDELGLMLSHPTFNSRETEGR